MKYCSFVESLLNQIIILRGWWRREGVTLAAVHGMGHLQSQSPADMQAK